MFSFFKKKVEAPDLSAAPRDYSFIGTDIHSHLVPGIDDGAPDMETSLLMISRLKELGYSRLITTPHIMSGFYDNNPEIITGVFSDLAQQASVLYPGLSMDVAAEYFLDNVFLPSVLPQGLMSFGAEKYVLVEVSMAGWQHQFSDMIFTIQSQGHIPVLAHPERYLFEENVSVYEEWKRKGMNFQLNILALSGYYGKGVRMAALRYMEHGIYDFCGTDAHHLRHVDALEHMAAQQPEMMLKLAEYPHWKNSSL